MRLRLTYIPAVAFTTLVQITWAGPAANPVGCTDGGTFTGARISADGGTIRYCIDETCWSFDATQGATPISAAAAHVARRGDATIVLYSPYDVPDPPPAPKPWRASASENQVEVCGPAGCAPFPIIRLKGDPPPDADYVSDVAISDSGTRVVVRRGNDADWHMPVELYDRASHKRLGVIRPTKMECTRLEGFAGESAIIQEWHCANQGGPRDIISPSGTLIAQIAGYFGNADELVHVDGDRWAFLDSDQFAISIYDVVTGKRIGQPITGMSFAAVGVVASKLFVFDDNGKLRVFDRDAHVIAETTPPTCRWTWEHETIGSLRFDMTGPELRKLLGAPRTTSKRDSEDHVVVTYPNGLSIRLQTFEQPVSGDPCSGGPQPARVIAIDVTAPSKLATRSGIAIGSPVAALDAAYGIHRIVGRSSATKQVFSNDDDTAGWTFEIADGKVVAIHVGPL